MNLWWPHPEIGDADVAAAVKQDIARLDVTVDVPVIVEVLEPCTHSSIYTIKHLDRESSLWCHRGAQAGHRIAVHMWVYGNIREGSDDI